MGHYKKKTILTNLRKNMLSIQSIATIRNPLLLINHCAFMVD
ncbi:hypothetical protein QY96_03869 [Bacillus thermotolerans]|nr:hypothetical protein QY96_03869 [Bacillus thermotolerans]